MRILILFIVLTSLLSLTSCGYIFREIATPSNCKKCEIFNLNGDIVWSTDECGGEVYNMELRAKAKAYDYGCNHTLSCKSYKKPKK
jgi:hypothetical protein